MKKIISLLLVCLMVVPFGMLASVSVSAADDVLYVKDGGTGDGSSADKALGTIDAAYAAAKKSGKDTTVVVVGDVPFNIQATYGFYPEKHAGKITITGKYGSVVGGRLLISAGDQHHWVLSGELELNNIELGVKELDSATKKNIVFRCHFNPITFGDGVVVASGVGIYIVGGVVDAKPAGHPDVATNPEKFVDKTNYDEATNTYKGDCRITLKSGTFKEVGIMSRGGYSTVAPFVGTSTLILSGTASVEKIVEFRNCKNLISGDVNILLDGGKILNWIGHNQYGADTVTGVDKNSKFTIVATKNFDIEDSFNAAAAAGYISGIAGSTVKTDSFESVLEIADLGEYRFFAEASVFEEIKASGKLYAESFDKVDKFTGTYLDESGKNPFDTASQGTTPSLPPEVPTGDMTWVVAAVAAIAVMGCAVVVSKKRA